MNNYIVKIEVSVNGDSIEEAKQNAIQYFNELTSIKNNEIKEL